MQSLNVCQQLEREPTASPQGVKHVVVVCVGVVAVPVQDVVADLQYQAEPRRYIAGPRQDKECISQDRKRNSILNGAVEAAAAGRWLKGHV